MVVTRCIVLQRDINDSFKICSPASINWISVGREQMGWKKVTNVYKSYLCDVARCVGKDKWKAILQIQPHPLLISACYISQWCLNVFYAPSLLFAQRCTLQYHGWKYSRLLIIKSLFRNKIRHHTLFSILFFCFIEYFYLIIFICVCVRMCV